MRNPLTGFAPLWDKSLSLGNFSYKNEVGALLTRIQGFVMPQTNEKEEGRIQTLNL